MTYYLIGHHGALCVGPGDPSLGLPLAIIDGDALIEVELVVGEDPDADPSEDEEDVD